MATHLLVLGLGGTNNAQLWNTNRVNFRWNDSFTAFQPIVAPYVDEASWIANESFDRCGAEEPIDETVTAEVQEPEFFRGESVEKMPADHMWF